MSRGKYSRQRSMKTPTFASLQKKPRSIESAWLSTHRLVVGLFWATAVMWHRDIDTHCSPKSQEPAFTSQEEKTFSYKASAHTFMSTRSFSSHFCTLFLYFHFRSLYLGFHSSAFSTCPPLPKWPGYHQSRWSQELHMNDKLDHSYTAEIPL